MVAYFSSILELITLFSGLVLGMCIMLGSGIYRIQHKRGLAGVCEVVLAAFVGVKACLA